MCLLNAQSESILVLVEHGDSRSTSLALLDIRKAGLDDRLTAGKPTKLSCLLAKVATCL